MAIPVPGLASVTLTSDRDWPEARCVIGIRWAAFAVAHPERSAALVIYGSFARRLRSADYPWGWPAEHLEEVLRGMDRGWATGQWWAAANPRVDGDERYQAWWARYLRGR